MFNIEVLDAGTSKKIDLKPGSNLLDTLRSAGVHIRMGCQKIGACALCKVLIRDGNAGPITLAEEIQLGHRLSQGMRLACQVFPEGDLVVELIPEASTVAPMLEWVGIKSEYLPDKCLGETLAITDCGLAIDIGTTNISISILRRSNGERLAIRTFSNPQREYGTDVITRILKASEDLSIAKDLQSKLFDKIKEILQELVQAAAIRMEDITKVSIVGNTAMLTLVHGTFYQQLLDPKHWEETLVFPNTKGKDVADYLTLQQDARVEIINPLAGFVGSDFLAGVTAIRLLDKEPGTLFLDFGTNTEMALWDGETVWVTAAAGGPAFEGCGMSYGVAAIPGAIFHVGPSNTPEELFKTLTIDGKDAVGICGSGYIGIIGTLLDMEFIDSIGRLSKETVPCQEIPVTGHPLIKITKQDIDMLQRAKAAVEAGIRVLLQKGEIPSTEIKQIYVAGNFGRFLDVPNAQRIGLLPTVDPGNVLLCGNAALQGCEDIMEHNAAREMLANIRKKANYINLAFYPEFESIFMDSLYLRPF